MWNRSRCGTCMNFDNLCAVKFRKFREFSLLKQCNSCSTAFTPPVKNNEFYVAIVQLFVLLTCQNPGESAEIDSLIRVSIPIAVECRIIRISFAVM